MKKLRLFLLLCFALFASSAFARDLKEGLSGDDVKQWQIFLNTRNFDLPANGQFGPATKRATIIFQKKWNLYADGVVGSQTLEKAKSLGAATTSTRISKATPSSHAIVTKDGTLFLPVRDVVDYVNSTMQVDKKTGVITVRGTSDNLKFTIGNRSWYLGNKGFYFGKSKVAPFVRNGVVYFYADVIYSIFGLKYSYIGSITVISREDESQVGELRLVTDGAQKPAPRPQPAPRPKQPTNPPYIPGVPLSSIIGTLGDAPDVDIDARTSRRLNQAFSHLKITKETEKGLIHIRFYFAENAGAASYTTGYGFLVRFFDSNGSYLSSINTESLKYDFTDTNYVGWKSFTYRVNIRDLRDAKIAEFGFSPFKN